MSHENLTSDLTPHNLLFLQRAFDLAHNIDPKKTSPNPRVGCVIVFENKILAEGFHAKFGDSHAEKKAFKNLEKYFSENKISEFHKKNILKHLNIFITLEPCDEFEGKKTPSCSNLLLKYKPENIFVGKIDPHFKGQNIKKLQDLGLNIKILKNDFHENLNPFFEKNILEKKPYITLKVAQSLNGKITNRKNKSQYLSSQESLKEVHFMRSYFSAILTTTETILQDNPSFDIRFDFKKEVINPDIIILGKRKIPQDFNLFKIKNRKLYFLEKLDDLENFCKKNNIFSIMTECGGDLNSQLLEKKLVDEIKIFIAPMFLHKDEVSSFNQDINLKNNFIIQKIEKKDSDVLLTYKRKSIKI